jgi:hypothetical protein
VLGETAGAAETRLERDQVRGGAGEPGGDLLHLLRSHPAQEREREVQVLRRCPSEPREVSERRHEIEDRCSDLLGQLDGGEQPEAGVGGHRFGSDVPGSGNPAR